jgi:hypothetical protein
LGMTTGSPPSMTAIQELVVPRSIPRMRLMPPQLAVDVPHRSHMLQPSATGRLKKLSGPITTDVVPPVSAVMTHLLSHDGVDGARCGTHGVSRAS